MGVAALVVAIGAGVGTAFLLQDDDSDRDSAKSDQVSTDKDKADSGSTGDGEPEKLSADEYVEQLCKITEPIIIELPPKARVEQANNTGSIDGTRESIDLNRELVVGIKKLVVAEQAFAESHVYDGVGGTELREATTAGTDELETAIDTGISVLDELSGVFEDFIGNESPTATDLAELRSQASELQTEFDEAMPEKHELPGDSDGLFAGVQFAEEAPSGDLEEALVTLDDAAHSSSACTTTLAYGN